MVGVMLQIVYNWLCVCVCVCVCVCLCVCVCAANFTLQCTQYIIQRLGIKCIVCKQ